MCVDNDPRPPIAPIAGGSAGGRDLRLTSADGTRFIDAPQIGAIAEHRVDLKLTAEAIRAQPEHEVGAPMYEARAETSRWQDLWRRITLRRLWKRD